MAGLLALALLASPPGAPRFDPDRPLPCVVTNETCQHACKARPHVGGCRFACAGHELACFVTPTVHRPSARASLPAANAGR